MKHLLRTLCAVGAVFGSAICAGHDLPINGDFYGMPTPHHIVPGWTSSRRGARLLPWHKGKQILELTSPRSAAKVAVSELQPAAVGMLELEADVSGTGAASLGFEAFDATRRRIVQTGKQSWPLSGIVNKIKFNFPLTAPDIAFIRITLTAEPGSIARFADVEADLKYGVVPVATAPAAVTAPAPAPAPAPVESNLSAQPAAPAPPVPVPVPTAQMLMHDGFYPLESLPPVSVFQTSVPWGKDIDFKLGENPGQFWQLVGSYDPRICRVEMEHKFKGYGYAKIELNAMYRGTTAVEFVNTVGKRVIVHFTSL